jgi:predicted regulator of Ras-like GTPase activity (Roadblock/LC7/MglB family)
MPFNYLLTNLLVDVPEAVGAIFLDHEGEAIEWVSRHDDPYELKVEGAYHSIFKRQLETLANNLEIGEMSSYCVVGDNLATLTQTLPHGYYVVLVVKRSGPMGRAMFHLRAAADTIARELD